MIDIFEFVDKFFASLPGFDINYNICFLVFVGLFLFTIICVVIATSKSYESKLTKAVDMLNNYFMQNPKITEENLLAFNDKMKSKKVPKQLRKQWQQYVLYRENKASTYMSFENCVSNPIQNSSFKRSLKVLNILAYVFSIAALLLNLYVSYESNVIAVLQKSLVAPSFILILNFIVSMFLNFRHNAIVSDLYQNYQYFEINIDKATKTLPEYVDYEVLFDKNEIKRGIPILYTYLQKRAEDEQRELELARLKNVEHEKFNFDEAGIAASLVLERAMQEAENYIAERKKYNQDTEQINNDITQEDMNYREITKEYNRQMQVSKETFANFKSQLEEASSSIEANYIKKQQQQELDRQRNLERDFDTATERHKKIIESYQAELDSVDKFRAKSRKVLEDAMMSEFETYGSKVYDEAKKIVEEREKEKYNKIKQHIQDLEEKLVAKEQELEDIYSINQSLNDKLEDMGVSTSSIYEERVEQPVKTEPQVVKEEIVTPTEVKEEPVETTQNFEIPKVTPNMSETEFKEPLYESEEADQFEEDQFEETDQVQEDLNEENFEDYDFDSYNENEEYNFNEEDWEDWSEESDDMQDFEEFNPEDTVNESDNSEDEDGALTADDYNWDEAEFEEFDSEEQPLQNFEEGENSEEEYFSNDLGVNLPNQNISTNQNESEMSGVAKRKAGRPRKEKSEDNKPKRGRGRPKKAKVEVVNDQPKKKPGRPKKEATETKPLVKKGRGRPKKVETTQEKPVVKKGRGRPKKDVETIQTSKSVVKKGRGRPKKEATETKPLVKKGRGRPKKVETIQEKPVVKKGRGRPKKNLVNDQFKNIEDIDAYLKEIDSVIAEENAKFEASKKALENKANLKNKK